MRRVAVAQRLVEVFAEQPARPAPAIQGQRVSIVVGVSGDPQIVLSDGVGQAVPTLVQAGVPQSDVCGGRRALGDGVEVGQARAPVMTHEVQFGACHQGVGITRPKLQGLLDIGHGQEDLAIGQAHFRALVDIVRVVRRHGDRAVEIGHGGGIVASIRESAAPAAKPRGVLGFRIARIRSAGLRGIGVRRADRGRVVRRHAERLGHQVEYGPAVVGEIHLLLADRDEDSMREEEVGSHQHVGVGQIGAHDLDLRVLDLLVADLDRGEGNDEGLNQPPPKALPTRPFG